MKNTKFKVKIFFPIVHSYFHEMKSRKDMSDFSIGKKTEEKKVRNFILNRSLEGRNEVCSHTTVATDELCKILNTQLTKFTCVEAGFR